MDQGHVWILESRKEFTNGIKEGISVRRHCKKQQVGSDQSALYYPEESKLYPISSGEP